MGHLSKIRRHCNARLLLKALALSVCAWILFSGHHPSAAAALRVASEARAAHTPTVTEIWRDRDIEELDHATDLHFNMSDSHVLNLDHSTEAINKHIENTDQRVEKNREESNANALAIAGMQAENHVWFYVLGLLLTGSLAFQVRGALPGIPAVTPSAAPIGERP